jgi:hypothetical protein
MVLSFLQRDRKKERGKEKRENFYGLSLSAGYPAAAAR